MNQMQAAALFVQPAHLRTLQNNIEQPKLVQLLQQLQSEYSNYKYTVYRCACKIVHLQKLLFTTQIPYKLVLAVMDRHGIRHASANLMIPPFQLTSLLHDIYFACDKLGHFSKITAFQLEDAVALLSNFFWSIFDPQRRHSISLLEIKCTFLLLCKLYTLEQLIMECWHLLKDVKTQCVSKLAFEQLLHVFMKFITFLGEGNAYGVHNKQMCLQQCFERSTNAAGLSEQQFIALWSSTATRFIIYANLISLIKRIEDTAKLTHNSNCASCGMHKIQGIRFKCQTCKKLSLCMKCFATGYTSNRHVIGHRMFEVFAADEEMAEVSRQPTKCTHFLSKLCVLFCNAKKARQQQQQQQQQDDDTKQICNANDTCLDHNDDTELVTLGTNRSMNDAASVSLSAIVFEDEAGTRQNQGGMDALQPALTDLSQTANNALNVSGRLQTIIDRLLQQNAKLEQQLQRLRSCSAEEIAQFLSSHQKFLLEIINDMRNFSQVSSKCSISFPAFSTPNNSLGNNEPWAKNNSHLTHSINGADINRSYLDANKTDYSLNDISMWFNNQKEQQHTIKKTEMVATVAARDTEMSNFKLLLHKVKEIVEDSYSNNSELAEATQNLENVLEDIIKNEEHDRLQ